MPLCFIFLGHLAKLPTSLHVLVSGLVHMASNSLFERSPQEGSWSNQPLIELGSCLGEGCVPLHTTVDMAGKEFIIVSDDLAFRVKCQECPMFSWGGVLSTTNAQQGVMTGVNACWDCWGICWQAWWGRIPDATTLLFWAMDWAAELDILQLQPVFCP